ncbi:unnamed protein product [Linum trigynum]|uniref:Uncharacterized protein n=1 Tax=Linum trigynum TaxID=586398 RepID=A0AAV2FWN7_9ROSI
MVLSKISSQSDVSVHSTFASRYVRESLPRPPLQRPISATFFPQQSAAAAPNPNVFSISLAGPQGQIVGGIVAGGLVAAGTLFIIRREELRIRRRNRWGWRSRGLRLRFLAPAEEIRLGMAGCSSWRTAR